jgi:hypothetical protein
MLAVRGDRLERGRLAPSASSNAIVALRVCLPVLGHAESQLQSRLEDREKGNIGRSVKIR